LPTRHAQYETRNVGAVIPKYFAEREAVTGLTSFDQVGEIRHGA